MTKQWIPPNSKTTMKFMQQQKEKRMEMQVRSQDFLKGGYMDVWLYVRMGACSPRKFLEIRWSEIASEAILGQKQSGSS